MVVYSQPVPGTSGRRRVVTETIRKQVDNLSILGDEVIRDLHETPDLQKMLVDLASSKLESAHLHNDSEERQRSFESACRKFRRFPGAEKAYAMARRWWQ